MNFNTIFNELPFSVYKYQKPIIFEFSVCIFENRIKYKLTD